VYTTSNPTTTGIFNEWDKLKRLTTRYR